MKEHVLMVFRHSALALGCKSQGGKASELWALFRLNHTPPGLLTRRFSLRLYDDMSVRLMAERNDLFFVLKRYILMWEDYFINEP